MHLSPCCRRRQGPGQRGGHDRHHIAGVKGANSLILDQIEDDIIAFSESSPEPRVDELEKYVLADNDPWVYGGGR